MEVREYETMFAVEDEHWWYVGMQRITTTLLTRAYPGRTDLQILDAGCGTGAVLGYLAPFGTVVGCDISALALHLSKKRALSRLSQASVSYPPFKDDYFDLVASFDVLGHSAVNDYRAALDEFRRILKPGGRVMLRLPAYNWLHAHHDEVVHNIRRFTGVELQRALTATGFVVEKISYANTILFPLALTKRLLLEKISPPGPENESDVYRNPVWQDKLFARFLFIEASWLARQNLPFGLTVIALGRKL